ncbi:MAG: hypothetical protein QNJ04_14390 [Desulfobacterales bacterium]|nr:hypothetical protein [Desulfobacterales bacterium]
MPKNIGFVYTHFAVTNGATLEARKWARMLEAKGHDCFGFAGELDCGNNRSFLIPEAHFRHKPNQWINAYDSDAGSAAATTILRRRIIQCMGSSGLRLVVIQLDAGKFTDVSRLTCC